MNSSQNLFVALLITNNFAEMKSMVFKKYDVDNIFQVWLIEDWPGGPVRCLGAFHSFLETGFFSLVIRFILGTNIRFIQQQCFIVKFNIVRSVL
jgi:hypothetical protein